MIKDVHAVESEAGDHIIIKTGKKLCGTHYANPPQRPSRPMSVNTKKMLRLSDSSPKSPMADSYVKAKKMRH